jgi:hypothetical protein
MSLPEEYIQECPAVNVVIHSYTGKDLADFILSFQMFKMTASTFSTQCCTYRPSQAYVPVTRILVANSLPID